jgi:hypothetical protein
MFVTLVGFKLYACYMLPFKSIMTFCGLGYVIDHVLVG